MDEKLKSIMKNIHEACVQYGTEADGYVKLREGCQCGRIYEGGKGYDGTRDFVKTKAIVIMKKGEESCKPLRLSS